MVACINFFDVASHNVEGHRSYTVQYRESDLAFVSRVLAREGLVYRFEIDDSAPLGHKLIILADTTQAASCPEDATSSSSGGIRFHRASSQEQQDAIQVLGGVRQLQAAVSSTLVWDYKAKRGLAASVPTATAFASPNAPRLVQFEPEVDYQFASEPDAQRAMTLAQQAIEVFLQEQKLVISTPGTQRDQAPSPIRHPRLLQINQPLHHFL